jgi:hypothetical protein
VRVRKFGFWRSAVYSAAGARGQGSQVTSVPGDPFTSRSKADRPMAGHHDPGPRATLIWAGKGVGGAI